MEEPIEAGATPKFKCRLMDSGEIVRVKFSRRETYAEVAGTRLLWSLGFFADEVFPVKLRCYGCPAMDPSKPEGQERMERLISDAIIERNFPGKELEQFPDQGWRWSELRYVDPIPGGASLAEVDAFKLLAVFIQHGDSKPPQQRLGCYSQDLVWQNGHPICRRPVLMMQDLGATFGMSTNRIGGFSAMYYKGWERMKIWDTAKEEQVLKETGARKCFGQLRSPFKNGLISPEIHEEGRQLLVSLLNRLSDQQIRELFQAARIDMAEEIVIKNGKSVPVTIEDWVAAFKEKRAQIMSRTCASSSQ